MKAEIVCAVSYLKNPKCVVAIRLGYFVVTRFVKFCGWTTPYTFFHKTWFRFGNAKSLNFHLVNPTAISVLDIQRITVIVREDYLQANTHLMQIAGALNPLRLCFRLRNG